ncbi:hypothetical protein CFP56_040588 [Quercus suber]|uniref:Uncharacterized protein n=1 Tax=Quercus suber TaxID=58331 RepID=A0AAW0LLQ6_QUESU
MCGYKPKNKTNCTLVGLYVERIWVMRSANKPPVDIDEIPPLLQTAETEAETETDARTKEIR